MDGPAWYFCYTKYWGGSPQTEDVERKLRAQDEHSAVLEAIMIWEKEKRNAKPGMPNCPRTLGSRMYPHSPQLVYCSGARFIANASEA